MPPTHGFIGTLPCGCALWVAVDLLDADTTRGVMEALRQGLTVRRLPLSEAQEVRLQYDCPHAKPQPDPAQGEP